MRFAEIEVVDFGATGIVRCKRCRTYINPYVTWADNGRRWRCVIVSAVLPVLSAREHRTCQTCWIGESLLALNLSKRVFH